MTEAVYVLRSTSKEGESLETLCRYTTKSDMKQVLESDNREIVGGPFEYAIWIEGLKNGKKLRSVVGGVPHHHDFEKYIAEAKTQIGADDPNFPSHTEAKAAKLLLALRNAFEEKRESPETVTVNLIQPLPPAFLFGISKHCKLNLLTETCQWAKRPRPVKTYTERQKGAMEKNRKRKAPEPLQKEEDVLDVEASSDNLTQMLKDMTAIMNGPKCNLNKLKTELSKHIAAGAALSASISHSIKRQKLTAVPK